jgi:branched-chain amino acid transport system substrate-binding protein
MKALNTRLLAMAATAFMLSAGVAACGSRDDEDSGASSSGGADAAATVAGPVDTSKCPKGQESQGVTDKTITLASSVPQSGPLAVVGQEAQGMQAAFDVINEKGGVKGRQIELQVKDDAYDPAKTASNVNSFLKSGDVFALAGVAGTAPNLAIADRVDQQCVPNLGAVTGTPEVAGKAWTTITQQSNAVEVAVMADELKKIMPDAKVGIVYQNDDLGQSYVSALKKAGEAVGTSVVSEQSFEVGDATITSQVTSAEGDGANVLFFASAGGATCAQALDAAAGRFEAVLMSGGCAPKPVMSLAKPAAQKNVYNVLAYMDPQDPRFKDEPRVKEYLATLKKNAPKADPFSAITAQGYSNGFVIAEILEKAPNLTRGDVINTAKTITVEAPGVYIPGIDWTVAEGDVYPIESFEFVKWNPGSKIWEPEGEVNAKYEGKTSEVD